MSALLTDPRVVLHVGSDGTPLADALQAKGAVSVESLTAADVVAGELEGRDDVGCVVAGPAADPVAVAEAVREVSDRLPVLAYQTEGSEAVASEFSLAGGTAYYGADVPVETVRDEVLDAIDRFATRRRAAEEADILNVLFEEMSVSMYAKDAEGRHVRSARVPGGKSPEQLRGKTDLEAYEGDTTDAYEDDLRVIEDEERVFDRLEHYEADGQDHYLRTTKVPWYDEAGDVKGLVGLSWNVTDYEKQRRRLERHEERIEEFAEFVSHDLRGPLQVATGALDLAREADDADELDDALDRIDDALVRIQTMIGDLSSVVKEEQASTTIAADAPGETDLESGTAIAALARDVWDTVDASAAARLEVEFDADAIVHAAEESLRPILENLLQNAVDHAGPDVTIRIGPVDAGGFFVADDGPGIPPDSRQRVLERGYSTSDADSGGTGLHIVAEVVEQHGWELNIVESADGGARFEVHNSLTVADPGHRVDGEAVDLQESVDVGDVGVSGSATYDDVMDSWTVEGAGANIWRHENQFHFVPVELTGPASVRARVSEMDDHSEYSKAGVMVRGGLDADAPYGYVGVTPQHGTEVLWRTERGAAGVSQQLEDDPGSIPWYRVDRTGERVTTMVSTDGEEWLPVDQRGVALGDPVQVGLVVCSFVPERLCEATFTDVTVLAGDPE